MKTVSIILLIFALSASLSLEIDKTRYNCITTPDHLFCVDDKNNKYTGQCGDDFNLNSINNDKSSILHEFNRFRNDVAKGVADDKELEKVFKSSSNMNELKWSDTLEEMATIRVKKCDFEYINKMPNIKLASFVPGEMITNSLSKNYDASGSLTPWQAAIKTWKNELFKEKQFDPNNEKHTKRFPYDAAGFEHNYLLYSLLQLFKDDNYFVGCASSNYTDLNEEEHQLFACFIGPSKFSEDVDLIKSVGKTAKKCSSISTEYDGLCNTTDRKSFPSAEEMEDSMFGVTYTTIPSSSTSARNLPVLYHLSLVYIVYKFVLK